MIGLAMLIPPARTGEPSMGDQALVGGTSSSPVHRTPLRRTPSRRRVSLPAGSRARGGFPPLASELDVRHLQGGAALPAQRLERLAGGSPVVSDEGGVLAQPIRPEPLERRGH